MSTGVSERDTVVHVSPSAESAIPVELLIPAINHVPFHFTVRPVIADCVCVHDRPSLLVASPPGEEPVPIATHIVPFHANEFTVVNTLETSVHVLPSTERMMEYVPAPPITQAYPFQLTAKRSVIDADTDVEVHTSPSADRHTFVPPTASHVVPFHATCEILLVTLVELQVTPSSAE
jgi:hypothetical protein